jgi:L-aminopeptidase/D-esterase-like protein
VPDPEPLPFPEPVALGIPGVRVGHWTDPRARTGCTVVLLPEGTVASGEVRGGAPATREFALLAPERLVQRVDAVVLSGGSAFGLAAADGVMRLLAEHDVGFPTEGGPVPIVVGLSIFDLLVGDARVRPTADHGYLAATSAFNAADGIVMAGRFGAGAGATVGKWRGRARARDGGIGVAVVRADDLAVAALLVVNAFGDIDDGSPLAPRIERERSGVPAAPPGEAFGNTTVGVVITNATLTKAHCHLVAQSGHDGFARSLSPAHTLVDGDALVAAATGSLDRAVPVDEVRLLTVAAVEAAVRSVG